MCVHFRQRALLSATARLPCPLRFTPLSCRCFSWPLPLLAGAVLAGACTGAQAQMTTASELAPQPASGDTSSTALAQPAADLAQTGAAPDGDGTTPASEDPAFSPISQGKSFDIRIESPDDEVRKLLDRHLELKRYQKVSDLDDAELRQLLTNSETNIRQLLGTQGYFTPEIRQKLQAHVASSAAAAGGPLPEVVITVDPGPRTTVKQVDLNFAGAITNYPPALPQLGEIYNGWGLPQGDPFMQNAWSDAKTLALRGLQAERFPTAKLANSQAVIDPDTSSANLRIDYDSGPVYKYGPVQIKGAERYDPVIIERLTRVPRGADYKQRDMVDAQQRLLDSGYYTGAFVSVDTSPESNPENAPVLVQVQEAKLQKLVFGVGFSTDRGPRVSIDHTHNKEPVFGWRGINKLQVDKVRQAFSTALLAPPDDKLWRWLANASITREKYDDVTYNTQQLRFGRTKLEKSIDRTYYLQYDHDSVRFNDGTRDVSQALSANYVWTYRRFNSQTYPTSGYGIGLELGGGVTLQPQHTPFGRVAARYLGFLSLDEGLREGVGKALPLPKDLKAVATGNAAGLSDQPLLQAPTASSVLKRRNGELVVRLEGAGLYAKQGAVIPSNLLFLTGGDATVRGYGYQDIGVEDANGFITPGRYMVAGSLEYRRPLFLRGRPSDWDTVLYVDAGSVANRPQDLRPLKVGVGAGALWRSPVGPVQMSVAYGIQSKKVRLHMNLGFTF